MKYLRFLGGLVVLVAVGYGLYWWKSGGEESGMKTLGLQEIQIPAGTKILLLLLEGLDAGGSKVDDEVLMAVTEDVRLNGAIVIERGTRAIGKVTKSRGASLVSVLSNQPARLEIALGHLQLADGRKIEILSEDGQETYSFTQVNTAERVDASKIDKLWDNAATQKTLTELKESVIDGKELPNSRQSIADILGQAGLSKSKDLASGKTGRSSELTLDKALAAMQSGDVGSLSGFDAVLAAQALGEIADVASSVDHKLRGVFKGRTIRATIGTPVVAATAKPLSVTVKKRG